MPIHFEPKLIGECAERFRGFASRSLGIDRSDRRDHRSGNAGLHQRTVSSGNVYKLAGKSIKLYGFLELYTHFHFPRDQISCVTPQSLAKAGFYYYNQSDHVRCAWCKGVIAKWELGDNPFNEHVKFFPSCPRAALGPNVEIASKEINNIGILPIQQSKHDQFASLDVRIRSFENWPKSDVQAPDVLATAGFYYLDEGDHVRCFHCSGGLRSWQHEDDPWEEHAKWFPKCPFLELVKGEAYVQLVQSRMKPSLDEVMRGEVPTQALQMGFTDHEVRTVVKRKMKSSGRAYEDVKDLVMALLVLQDSREPEASSTSSSKLPEESKSKPVVSSSTFEMAPQSASSPVSEEDISISKASLEDENRQLKDARLCKVCMVEEVGIVFLPCGHLGKRSLLTPLDLPNSLIILFPSNYVQFPAFNVRPAFPLARSAEPPSKHTSERFSPSSITALLKPTYRDNRQSVIFMCILK